LRQTVEFAITADQGSLDVNEGASGCSTSHSQEVQVIEPLQEQTEFAQSQQAGIIIITEQAQHDCDVDCEEPSQDGQGLGTCSLICSHSLSDVDHHLYSGCQHVHVGDQGPGTESLRSSTLSLLTEESWPPVGDQGHLRPPAEPPPEVQKKENVGMTSQLIARRGIMRSGYVYEREPSLVMAKATEASRSLLGLVASERGGPERRDSPSEHSGEWCSPRRSESRSEGQNSHLSGLGGQREDAEGINHVRLQ